MSQEVETIGCSSETIENLTSIHTRMDTIERGLRDLNHKLDIILHLKSKPTGCGFTCSNNTCEM